MDMDTDFSKEIELGTNSTDETRESTSWQMDLLNSSRFWIPFVLTPVLFIISGICNGISIKILAKSSMRSPTNIYLRALAVSDLLYQVFSFTMSWKYYHFMGYVWIYWWYTPFGLWLTEAAYATSIWMIVLVTIERFIAVSGHVSRQIYFTEKRAMRASKIIFFSCFTFTGIFSYEWRGSFEPIDGNPTNETVYTLDSTEAWNEEKFKEAYHWVYTVYFFLIPIIILGGFNYYLFRFVRNARQDRRIMTRHPITGAFQRQLNGQVTTIVIAVSMMYIICNLPTNLLEIYTLVDEPTAGSTKESILIELRNIFNFLGRLNSICNISLYIGLDRNYRKHFWAIVCRRDVRNWDRNAPSSPRVCWRDGFHPAGDAIEMHNIAGDRN